MERRQWLVVLVGVVLVILMGAVGALSGWSRARGESLATNAGMMASVVSEN